MNAYSEDLRRQEVVEADERGTSKSEAACLFGISLTSAQRSARTGLEGSAPRRWRGADGPSLVNRGVVDFPGTACGAAHLVRAEASVATGGEVCSLPTVQGGTTP